MSMAEAIKRAIKGGWADEEALVFTKDRSFETKMRLCVILLDNLFWQALGKAEGWGNQEEFHSIWKYHWHSFIDHLAEGKDIDSFFNNLLKPSL